MSSTYNSGGGGIAIGAGAIATGAGSSVQNAQTNSGTNSVSLSGEQLDAVLRSILELKQFVAFSSIADKADIINKAHNLERAVLERPGQVEQSIALTLLNSVKNAFGAANEAVKFIAMVSAIFGLQFG